VRRAGRQAKRPSSVATKRQEVPGEKKASQWARNGSELGRHGPYRCQRVRSRVRALTCRRVPARKISARIRRQCRNDFTPGHGWYGQRNGDKRGMVPARRGAGCVSIIPATYMPPPATRPQRWLERFDGLRAGVGCPRGSEWWDLRAMGCWCLFGAATRRERFSSRCLVGCPPVGDGWTS
jgi:hypothetical protein